MAEEKFFNNRELIMLINEFSNRTDSLFFLNFGRNHEGLQGLIKLPFKFNVEGYVFFYQQEVDYNLEENRENKEDALLSLAYKINKDKRNEEVNKLINYTSITKNKAIVFYHIYNKRSNQREIKVLITNLNYYLTLIEFTKRKIPLTKNFLDKCSLFKGLYKNFNNKIKDDIIDFMIKNLILRERLKNFGKENSD